MAPPFGSPPQQRPSRNACFELSRTGCHCTRVMGVVFTTALIGFCFGTYLAYFLVPQLVQGSTVGIISAFLWVPPASLLLVSLWRTFFTHPGKVPPHFAIEIVDRKVQERRNELEARERHVRQLLGEPQEQAGAAASSATSEHARAFDAMLMTPRTCSKCNVYKVNRIHHCSTCGECILRMDHHCPWIGNCVGRDNHKFFILFIFYTIITGAVMTATSVTTVDFFFAEAKKGDSSNAGIGGTIAHFFGWMFTALFTVILTPFLMAIIGNATEGTTTLERKIRERNRKREAQLQQRQAQTASAASTAVNVPSGLGRRSPSHPADADRSWNEPTPATPLTAVVAIAEALPPPPSAATHAGRAVDEESDDDDADSSGQEAACSCCCNRQRLLVQLEEVLGDPKLERHPQSRLWWLLPTTPKFKPDDVNVDRCFLLAV